MAVAREERSRHESYDKALPEELSIYSVLSNQSSENFPLRLRRYSAVNPS
jgi:hypothetical protein